MGTAFGSLYDMVTPPSGSGFVELLDSRSNYEAARVFQVAKSDPALMKDILEYSVGYQPSRTNPAGWNALIAACHSWNVEMATELVNAGMDVNAATEEGERVLNWTLGTDRTPKSKNHPVGEIVRLLVSKGAILGPGYGNYPALVTFYTK